MSSARARTNRLLGLAPVWLLIGGLLLAPLLLVVAIAFTEQGAYGGVDWTFSGAAFVSLLYNVDFDGTASVEWSYVQIFLTSAALAGLTTAICLLVGFPVAYFISRQPPSRRSVLMLLVAIPFWTDLLVRIYAWMIILGNDGLIASALNALGAGWLYRNILFTPKAILLGMTYNYLPLMILPLCSSLEKLDGRLIEAAADLYASRWSRMKDVIIPLTAPGIAAGCMLVFIPAVGDFVTPTIIGGGKTLLFGNLVALQFGSAHNWPFGAAIAVVMLLLIGCAGALPLVIRRRLGRVA